MLIKVSRCFIFKLQAVIVAILFFAITSYSNDTTIVKNTNLLSLYSGFEYNTYQNPLASSRIYNGWALPIIIDFKTVKNKYTDNLNLGWSSYSLNPIKNNGTSLTKIMANRIYLSYFNYRNIYKLPRAIFLLGGGIGSQALINGFSYQFFHTVSYKTVDITSSVDFAALSKISINNDIFFLQFKYALVGCVMNNKYALGSLFTYDFFKLPQYNSFDFRAQYLHAITKRIYLNINYTYYYVSYPRIFKIDYLKSGSNFILLGLTLKL